MIQSLDAIARCASTGSRESGDVGMADGVLGGQAEQQPAQTKRPTCWDCRFWESGSAVARVDAGVCHRSPPGIIGVYREGRKESHAFWPRTLANQWCGEHRPQPEATR